MLYASLIGPLLGVYYPIGSDDDTTCRVYMNNSKLKHLWCSIYSEEKVDEQIRKWGGVKLPPDMAHRLDYDIYETDKELREIRNGSG